MIAIAVALLVLLGHVNEIIALLIGGLLGMLWLQLPDCGKQTEEEANILIACIATRTALVEIRYQRYTTHERFFLSTNRWGA